jgi:transposase
MRNQRTFSPEFKRQVVEELLSGVSTVGQLSRRYHLSSSLLYHWKRQYAQGTYDNEPTQEAALEERVRQLEQMLGKVILENEFLKKAVKKSLTEAEQNRRLPRKTGILSALSKGGANFGIKR